MLLVLVVLVTKVSMLLLPRVVLEWVFLLSPIFISFLVQST